MVLECTAQEEGFDKKRIYMNRRKRRSNQNCCPVGKGFCRHVMMMTS